MSYQLMSRLLEDLQMVTALEKTIKGKKLLERVGGKTVIASVHKIFYDKIYAHPWLGLYFQSRPQEHLEAQQTDFMAMLFGGPKDYSGRMPIDAHEHIMITDEMFDLRAELLRESLIEAQISEDEIKDWMRIDEAFRKTITKKSKADCKPRFADEGVVDFPKPFGKAS